MAGQTTSTFLVVVCAILMSACDTSFQPFAESGQYFTVMGYLDSDAATQFVRIVPLRQVVDRSLPLPIDATVRTTDLGSGEQIAWRDSLVQFPDSTYGHVFCARFRPQPEHRYRIEVERSDGAITSAETMLPPAPDASAVESVLNRGPFFQPLIWPGVTNVIDVDVLYRVNIKKDRRIDSPPSTATEVFIRYEDEDRGSLQGDAWWVEFQLVEDHPLVVEGLEKEGKFLRPQDGDLILLYSLTMRIAVPSEDWQPPGGIWDADVLVQPGTFSNVTSGLGFWGSVTRATVEHTLDNYSMSFFIFGPYTPG